MISRLGPGAILVAIVVLSLLPSPVPAATPPGTVSGWVRSTDGTPLAYANVILVGSTLGAMSLSDGKFTIVGVPAGTYTIRAMMMGYGHVEKTIGVNAGDNAPLTFFLRTVVVAEIPVIEVIAERLMVDVKDTQATGTVNAEQVR